LGVPGTEVIRNHAAFIWSVADLLRGDYKQSEYGRVILPLTVVRRLDCVPLLQEHRQALITAAVTGRAGGAGGRGVTIRPEDRIWPEELPVDGEGRIARGMVVWSRSGEIEGRTTGGRRVCGDPKCPGWQIGVKWETGQQFYVCSLGWAYQQDTRTFRMTAREISSTSPTIPDRRRPPLPRSEWPPRSELGPAWHPTRFDPT
jgi:hypothetical protein